MCDQAYCLNLDEPSIGNLTTGNFGYWRDCCFGHYEVDRGVMDAVSGNRSEFTGQDLGSNGDIIRGANAAASEYTMSYIYDDFDWTHCLDVGVDFTHVLSAPGDVSDSEEGGDSATLASESSINTFNLLESVV